MSDSNTNGRAFEYICLQTFLQKILLVRRAEIEEDAAFYIARNAWHTIDGDLQSALISSADVAVDAILNFEPLLVQKANDTLRLKIQPDAAGKKGDVRDILFIRKSISWEIGVSVKHNHSAVKHSRLAKAPDFGKNRFGVPCSDKYWRDVHPIFARLEREHSEGALRRDLPDKEHNVYIPLPERFYGEN